MKNKTRFIIPVFILALFMAVSCDSGSLTGDWGGGGNSHASLTNMKIGWNLGNSLDAHNNGDPSETVWGNPVVTQTLINAVKAQGFDTVRIPVTWINKIGPAPNYTIDAAWLNRVAEVVGYVSNAGMNAIINIHHDGADSSYWLSVKTDALTGAAKTEIDNKYKAVWTQIANKFKDYGDFLIFEGFNELHDGSWSDGNTAQRNRINDLNQIFVTTVRSTGEMNSERYLLINGWVTRPSVTVSSLVLPTDTAKNKLIVGIHYYDPYDFSHLTKSVWGSRADSSGWANESYVRSTFNSIKTRFIDKGIPVFIGEYGAVRKSDSTGKAHRLYYMEYVTKVAADCGFVPIYWDNGGSGSGENGFGLFNRSSGALLSDAADVISVIMRAAKEDYSLSSITPP
jgi:aryl-phospho-beta-D-glucosidase BglC (GH1 family)